MELCRPILTEKNSLVENSCGLSVSESCSGRILTVFLYHSDWLCLIVAVNDIRGTFRVIPCSAGLHNDSMSSHSSLSNI